MTLVIKFEPGLRPVLKHEQHDQATHGSWANGTSESSLISTDTQIAFAEGAIKATDNILSPSAYKSQLEGNLNRTYPKIYLEEAVNNPAYQDALQTHLKSIGFPETVKVFSSSAQEGEYFHGSVAPLWDSGAVGYESEESPKEFLVNRSDIIGLGKVADSGVWFRNSKTVKKHQEHDQKTHGNWATGGEMESWNPNDPIPASPRNAGGMTQKIWDNWEHGVDGNQYVELYRQYAGEALGIAVPKSSMDVGGNLNYLTQRGFGGSSTDTVRKQAETILQTIANGKPEQPALYRGMTATDADGQALLNSITKLKAGDTLDMPLVSTTRSLGVATWYATDRSTSGTGNVIMKIQPGAKGVSLSKETSRYPQDYEVITSGKFEVVSVNTIQSSYWQRGVLEPRKISYTDGSESHYEVATYSPRRYSPEEAKTIYETVTSGKYKSLETPTFKITNDRHNNYPDRPKLSTWEKQPAREFTVVEVKFIEPHVVRKAESKDYGLTFDSLFNNIPFIREEDMEKHQQGLHDQRTHGSWAMGGAGADITDELDKVFFNNKLNVKESKIFPGSLRIPTQAEIARAGMNDETIKLIEEMSQKQIESGQAYGDNALKIIAERQGFTGKPKTVATIEDLQKIQSTEAGILVYRGVTDYSRAQASGGGSVQPTYTAEQALTDFREGEYFGGWGVFGNGTYTTQRIDEAVSYSETMDLDNGKLGNGRVMAMLIPKNAKAPSETLVKSIVKDMVYGGEPSHRNNIGRRLASMGYQYYDAGHVQNDKYGTYVILDRSMLTVAEKAVG